MNFISYVTDKVYTCYEEKEGNLAVYNVLLIRNFLDPLSPYFETFPIPPKVVKTHTMMHRDGWGFTILFPPCDCDRAYQGCHQQGDLFLVEYCQNCLMYVRITILFHHAKYPTISLQEQNEFLREIYEKVKEETGRRYFYDDE